MSGPYTPIKITNASGTTPTPPTSEIHELVLALPAAEPLSALVMVWSDGTNVRPASASISTEVQRLVGLSLNSGAADAVIYVKRIGVVEDAFWTWSPGFIWLAEGGSLTQTPPTNTCVVVATALSATKILLTMFDPTFKE